MMIRIFCFLLLIGIPAVAYADETDAAVDEIASQENAVPIRQVPIMTFQQKVMCVTEAQKHPKVLKASVDQAGDVIDSRLVIANDQSRTQAKELAVSFIRLLKKKSLDDDPAKDKIGKGLYTYKIQVERANKAVLATGIKRFDEVVIEWAINDDGVKNDAMIGDALAQ